MNEYILIGTSLVICFSSMVISSRKNGYIIGLGMRSRDKYSIDQSALGDYCIMMLLIAVGCLIFGMFFSEDISIAFAFTVMNVAFIGYALAWEKVIKLK